MGFKFASFGAATVPLSKIIVDKDLNMGPYAIKGAYRPEEWATETLDWGDIPAETVLPPTQKTWTKESPTVDIYTADIGGYYTLTIVPVPGKFQLASSELRINGIKVANYGNVPWTSDNLMLNAGDVLSVYSTNYTGGASINSSTCECTVVFTGKMGGHKTFDLTGKWLAPGIDMKGLAATVKILGDEVPYSDYIYYFPLAPTELKIPGGWAPSQQRPEIKVYKNV